MPELRSPVNDRRSLRFSGGSMAGKGRRMSGAIAWRRIWMSMRA